MNVNRYLPEKYKNQNYVRLEKTIGNVENSISSSQIDYNNIEDCTDTSELIDNLKAIKNCKNESEKIPTFLNNTANKIRSRLVDLGITEVEELDEKYRNDISAKKYKFEVPQELEEINKGTVYWLKRHGKAWERYATTFEEFGPSEESDARKYFQVAKTACLITEACSDFKMSGELCFWFDREYWKNVQSAHYAGNSTYHETSLCAYCSADVEEDENNYHIMKIDKTSESGYRCDRCNGIKVRKRFVSRENVTDKEGDIFRMAYNVMQYIPFYNDLMLHCRNKYFNPPINSRKLIIAPKFGESSFGTSTTFIKKDSNLD